MVNAFENLMIICKYLFTFVTEKDRKKVHESSGARFPVLVYTVARRAIAQSINSP